MKFSSLTDKYVEIRTSLTLHIQLTYIDPTVL